MNLEESHHGLYEVLSQHLPEETEETLRVGLQCLDQMTIRMQKDQNHCSIVNSDNCHGLKSHASHRWFKYVSGANAGSYLMQTIHPFFFLAPQLGLNLSLFNHRPLYTPSVSIQ
jgi:hypothetical protein